MAAPAEKQSDFRRRFTRAKAEADRMRPLLQREYQLLVPAHAPAFDEGANPANTAQNYDATGSLAVSDRAGDLHDKLFPPFDEWADFSGKDAPAELLQALRETFHDAIEASNFHSEIEQPLEECIMSVGCIELHRGEADNPLHFEAVSAADLVVAQGRDGRLTDTWRLRRLPLCDIADVWPEAVLPAEWERQLQDDPYAEVALLEGEIYDAVRKQWIVEVQPLEKDGEQPIFRAERRRRRRIAFRMAKAAKRAWGFGPGRRVFPDAHTANKTVELTLKNASLAVSGIWQAEDDGVLNPANIKLVPGAIIPKASGSSGLTPLAPAGRFDVGQVVLADTRGQVQRGIQGPLPPDGAKSSRRTAFEIERDERRAARLDLPRTLHVLKELHEALVLAVLDVLADPYLIGSRFHVEDFPTGAIWPISPLMRLRAQAKAEQAMRTYATALSIDQETTMAVVDREAFIRWYLDYGSMPVEAVLPEGAAAQPQAPNPLEAAAGAGAEAAAKAAGTELGRQAGASLADEAGMGGIAEGFGSV
ncbi:portal protein [Ferrovibrio sp.]|uniref:portal protein n=1 Tax=Ferrovibrio sp. TaxID=1917215 RepID=UPI003D0FE961